MTYAQPSISFNRHRAYISLPRNTDSCILWKLPGSTSQGIARFTVILFLLAFFFFFSFFFPPFSQHPRYRFAGTYLQRDSFILLSVRSLMKTPRRSPRLLLSFAFSRFGRRRFCFFPPGEKGGKGEERAGCDCCELFAVCCQRECVNARLQGN